MKTNYYTGDQSTRLAGQGALELGQTGKYWRVIIYYTNQPSTCFKAKASSKEALFEALPRLSPTYATQRKHALEIHIEPWNQFQAVLWRNL